MFLPKDYYFQSRRKRLYWLKKYRHVSRETEVLARLIMASGGLIAGTFIIGEDTHVQ